MYIHLPEEDPSGIEMLQDDTFGLSARKALHHFCGNTFQVVASGIL